MRGPRGALGGTTPFLGDRLGIDEPLAIAGPAGLLLLCAGEAPEGEEATDFGAGGVHYNGGLLRGEPMVSTRRHGGVLRVERRQQSHCSVSY